MDKETVIFDPVYDKNEKARSSLSILQEKFVKYALQREDLNLRIVVPENKDVIDIDYEKLWGKTEFTPVIHDRFSESTGGKVNGSWSKLARHSDYYLYFTTRILGTFDAIDLQRKGYIFKPKGIQWLIFDHPEQSWFQLHELTGLAAHSFVNFPTIFTNQKIFEVWLSIIKQTYSASVTKKFIEQSHIINLGIDCDLIDSLRGVPKDETFSFVYGGRYSATKNVDLMVEIVEKMYKQGKKVKLKLFIVQRGGSKDEFPFKDKPFIELHWNDTQEEFIKGVLSSHSFICPTETESYGLMWLELLYAGLPGIYLKKDWIRDVVPPDYKFIAGNKEELFVMADYIFDNYEKIDVTGNINFVRDNHNTKVSMNKICDLLVNTSKKLRLKL